MFDLAEKPMTMSVNDAVTQPARATGVEVRVHESGDLARHEARWRAFMKRGVTVAPWRDPGWLFVLRDGLGHVPYCLESVENGATTGLLPLAFVRSILFGRFLVSMPYLNSSGIVAESDDAAHVLVDEAVRLADRLNVQYLELRQERPVEHPALSECRTDKVHVRKRLPRTAEQLWSELPSKVRNQVRKGERSELAVNWGGAELLGDFYAVFSRNMRDLGTPVYSSRLFTRIIEQFTGRAELCVVRSGPMPIAGALLVHGDGISEVPSASSLREYNSTNANMVMYWQLLKRAVDRGQSEFDFGRSSRDSSTHRFKSQWDTESEPANWQYYVRFGSPAAVRLDNPKYRLRVRIWQRLPLFVTRWIGPYIVRGIP